MIDSKIEKQIVTGMIVSTEFLEGISPIFKNQLQIPFTNKVGGWCFNYFKQYSIAPNKHIQDIFKKESKNLKNEDKFLIEEFLKRLSKRYKTSKKFNVSYILEIAEEYLRLINVDSTHKKLGTAIEKSAVTRAENIIKRFERTVRPQTKGINPFSKEAILKAFNNDDVDKLFKFPGELGNIVQAFEREYLTAFFGVRGTGKTWWLLWTGLLAVQHGYNVVFVSLEMSEKQIIKRIHQYLNAKSPTKKKIEIPIFHDSNEDEDIQTIFKTKTRKQLNAEIAMKKLSDIDEANLIKANFRLLTFPSGTATMSDLRSQLNNMESYEGFIPDVIITDYADKFKPEIDGEMRHKIGDIWKSHKALGQERKCAVFTASQVNTVRTGKDIGIGTGAESLEKENESDLIIALNQKPEDKKNGLMRVCLTKHRHEEFHVIEEVYVTQCLSIGRCYLDSKIKV